METRPKNLQSLDLSYNKLHSLSEYLTQLANLQSLDLSSNQLQEIPKNIAQLANLQALYLSSNQLQEIPEHITQLSNLQSLDLSSNQLQKIPEHIAQLSNLQSLDLIYNQLQEISINIGLLQNLTSLSLSNNPNLQLPPEIKAKDAQTIVNYYKQRLEQDTICLYEAKLLIIGEPGAGKTSLTKKIIDNNYRLRDNEKSTEGIEIAKWMFECEDGTPFTVNIWDFGGQEIYHSTHQFFLTKRSLYALVADTRKEDTDFFYWLNIAELLSDASPLIIIKNEKQDRKRQINENLLRGRFKNLKETLETNLETNRGLERIEDSIKYNIFRLPHVGQELPKKWISVRGELEREERNYISQETYYNICKRYGFEDEKDIETLGGYLHDLGVCLYFQEDPLLRKTIILKPTWGTDAVYKVLDNHKVIENLGNFSDSDLRNIWADKQYKNVRPELLQLMMKFKLCYPIPRVKGKYIAPQLLEDKPPKYQWDEDNNLILRYEYDFMPKGIIRRLIVAMNELIEEQKLEWKTGTILNDGLARVEIIELYNKQEIHVRTSGIRQSNLLEKVRHELKKIHDSYEGLKYRELIPCNCNRCYNSQDPESYPYELLLQFLKDKQYNIDCRKSYKRVSIKELIDNIKSRDKQESTEFLKRHNEIPRDQVFVSYSHEDGDWHKQLKKHLKPMRIKQSLYTWDDTEIQPGDVWRDEIQTALDSAKVAVLLVSPDFLASDFIVNNELPPLLDKAEAQGLRIIWVPISYSNYEETEIEKYHAALSPEQPLKSLSEAEQDKAWVTISKIIKEAYQS